MFQSLLIAVLSAALFWLVWIYGNGLRDPRYLDGWILVGGMCLQLGFHIAIKTARLKPRTALFWQKVHIFVGYLLIAAFVSHLDFSLPDTGLEWALWVCFVLVTLSAILGTQLARSQEVKRSGEWVSSERIETRRAELAQTLYGIVSKKDLVSSAIALPSTPYDDWVMDLYTNHLRYFFEGQRNAAAHLIGSPRPLKRLTNEIDALSKYVDKAGQDKLAAIVSLVAEKDRLDLAAANLRLTKGWLFVHVPVTYALAVLTVAHVLVVYAFSSGDW